MVSPQEQIFFIQQIQSRLAKHLELILSLRSQLFCIGLFKNPLCSRKRAEFLHNKYECQEPEV